MSKCLIQLCLSLKRLSRRQWLHCLPYSAQEELLKKQIFTYMCKISGSGTTFTKTTLTSEV